MIRVFLTLAFFLFAAQVFAQKVYRGIVVDSVTLKNLPDVHIAIKNSATGIVTQADGSFRIAARPIDTLIFTSLGYKPLILPLLFEEDAIMIMLKENVQMLANITVKATRLYPNKIEDRTREEPKRMDPLQAVISPIDYFFWREERDRRKLAKYVRENNRTQTYRQVIADPDVKKIMMDTYSINDEKYYDLIVRFNQENGALHYATDADEIMEALYEFFSRVLNRN
ncbi:MAG: carboxypeptidase-like regulatory domain-containing protein [Cyclobacteriaceae bacterium]|nr:carboxypeptidase-like regulatory domain-containing protein [Cyclobacteriaceae bacterium]